MNLLRFNVSTALVTLLLAGCGTTPMGVLPQVSTVNQLARTVSPAEAEARRLFAAMDANGDGRLYYKEVLNAPTGQPVGGWKPGEKEQQAKALFAKLDTNRNGYLSYSEFKAGATGQAMTTDAGQQAARAFALSDANGDGRLTLQEALNAPTGRPVGGWKPGEKEAQARALFAKADANRDGVLTIGEIRATLTGQSMVR